MSSTAQPPSSAHTLSDLSHPDLRTHRRIALLTDGYSTPFLAKTAISLLRYRGPDVAAVIESSAAGKTANDLFATGDEIPVVDGLDAIPSCDALYVGIAPPGGKLPSQWRPLIVDALRRGIDVASGLHDFLTEDPELLAAASGSGAKLIDVRRNRFKNTAQAHAFPKENLRVHTVGQDCSIGKMVASIEIQRGLSSAGHQAKFLATGQTGIMVSGEGVPIDCVIADFVSGAAEQLARSGESSDFSLIEGQGSISHPAYAAVTLGLLHGCAPDALVFCYEAGRTHVKGFDHVEIPPPERQMEVLLAMANLRHPCRFIGIAVNTRHLDADAAAQELEQAERRFGLPACDVYRTGADKLVQACIQCREQQVRS